MQLQGAIIGNSMNAASSADSVKKQGRGHCGRGAMFLSLIAAILLALLVNKPVCAAQLSLIWDPSGSSGVTGYKIYYGTESGDYSGFVDAGNATTCAIPDLVVGTTYYIAATAYDNYGHESGYSNELVYKVTGDATVTMASSSGGGGGGGGGCFIATAAFGSYLDPHVAVLRSFRDTFLLTNRPGKAFVAWYYATSPGYADAIRQSEPLKAVVRIALFPVIGFSYLCLTTGIVPALLLTITFLAALTWGARGLWVRRASEARIS